MHMSCEELTATGCWDGEQGKQGRTREAPVFHPSTSTPHFHCPFQFCRAADGKKPEGGDKGSGRSDY